MDFFREMKEILIISFFSESITGLQANTSRMLFFSEIQFSGVGSVIDQRPASFNMSASGKSQRIGRDVRINNRNCPIHKFLTHL